MGIVIGGALPATARGAQDPPRVNPVAQSFAEMLSRVNDYVALHNRIEATLPPLPNDATREQIDGHQRALARGIERARSDAAPGGIFTRESRGVIRGLMKRVFAGPEGARLKATIMEDNPGRLLLKVNSRYPDDIPLSTVPPQVLANLPSLPPDVEYRFVGRALILMDVHAHLIVDLIENAIP
jgi:hypothetical protein